MAKRLIVLLAAGMGTALIPVLAAIAGILNGPGWIGDRPDNAPYRAAWGLLFLSPLFLVMSIGYWAIVLRIAKAYEKLWLRSVLFAHVASSMCILVYFAGASYRKFGVVDVILSLTVFGLSMVCLGCGTLACKLVLHMILRSDRQVTSTER